MWGPGYVLKDRWILESQIAHGSYSTVWRARDARSEQLVAVKNLRVSAQLDSAKRALREVEMLKHFRGTENIIQIFDIAIIPGVSACVEEICIVTELMDQDLHTLIQSEESLSEEVICFIMFQILCGVEVMHSAQTLHRDLKPKNILLNYDCETKICDLGMGRAKVESGSLLKMTLISRVATASYRAPDALLRFHPSTHCDSQLGSGGDVTPLNTTDKDDSEHYTTAIDVWACGCILAEMFTRQPIFPHKDNASLLSAFVNLLGAPSSDAIERMAPGTARNQLLDAISKHGGASPVLRSRFPPESTQALDLCLKMLQFEPEKRITVEQALRHPWFANFCAASSSIPPFEDPTDDPLLSIDDCNRLIVDVAEGFSPPATL